MNPEELAGLTEHVAAIKRLLNIGIVGIVLALALAIVAMASRR